MDRVRVTLSARNNRLPSLLDASLIERAWCAARASDAHVFNAPKFRLHAATFAPTHPTLEGTRAIHEGTHEIRAIHEGRHTLQIELGITDYRYSLFTRQFDSFKHAFDIKF